MSAKRSLGLALLAIALLAIAVLGGVDCAAKQDVWVPPRVDLRGYGTLVDAVLVGDLDVEQPKPSWSVHSFTEASASAEIHGTLDARIFDTNSGATIWSDSVAGKRTIASLDLAAGVRPRLDAVDPEGEEARLVGWLVGRVTRDFAGYWERR